MSLRIYGKLEPCVWHRDLRHILWHSKLSGLSWVCKRQTAIPLGLHFQKKGRVAVLITYAPGPLKAAAQRCQWAGETQALGFLMGGKHNHCRNLVMGLWATPTKPGRWEESLWLLRPHSRLCLQRTHRFLLNKAGREGGTGGEATDSVRVSGTLPNPAFSGPDWLSFLGTWLF